MGSLVLFATLLIGIFIGIPVAFALCLASTVTILLFDTATLLFQARSIVQAINTFPLLAVPLFILAGDLMFTGGLSRRLVVLAESLVGSFKANLAYATVLASTFFAAISGSGPATVAAIGANVIPEMEKKGYTKDYGTALSAVSGMIGVMIPPSIPFIMYGISSEESVMRLFMAGVVPGLLFAVGFMIMARLLYSKYKFDVELVPFSGKRAWKSFKEAFWAVLAPVIILGGIYGGFFSPTEAAAIGVAYALIVGLFIYRELTFKMVFETFRRATLTTATCISLVAFASTFGRLLTLQQVPQKLALMLTSLSDNPMVIMFIILIFLLVVGMFMETIASIIILTPILLPVVKSYNVDPILFGVIITVSLAIGFCTPPVGVNLFVASGISNLSIERITRAILPYFIVMAVILLLISYVPAVSLTLPNIILGVRQ